MFPSRYLDGLSQYLGQQDALGKSTCLTLRWHKPKLSQWVGRSLVAKVTGTDQNLLPLLFESGDKEGPPGLCTLSGVLDSFGGRMWFLWLDVRSMDVFASPLHAGTVRIVLVTLRFCGEIIFRPWMHWAFFRNVGLNCSVPLGRLYTSLPGAPGTSHVPAPSSWLPHWSQIPCMSPK